MAPFLAFAVVSGSCRDAVAPTPGKTGLCHRSEEKGLVVSHRARSGSGFSDSYLLSPPRTWVYPALNSSATCSVPGGRLSRTESSLVTGPFRAVRRR